MTPIVTPHRPAKRRSPTRKGSGLAQQTLVEHAPCPLNASLALQAGSLHQVRYDFTDWHRNRKTATATVACPFGLSPKDELYLYGLLALTFAQPEATTDFYATPHWCLRQLGLIEAGQEQGNRYQLFRDAIRRRAGVVYENDHFYDPLRSEHRQLAFGLLKYSLPLDDTSSRAWHFVWDAQWFRYCEAVVGSFTFDFGTYRQLDVASRRMFLLLSKMFWRNDHSPAFELRQLGINTLGFAETLATKEIKQKLVRVSQALLDQEIISLPPDINSVRGLFTKRTKGVHVVQFPRGVYFERVTQPPVTFTADESPLVEPLEKIGFDRATIRRILGEFPPRLIAEWSDITLAATERKAGWPCSSRCWLRRSFTSLNPQLPARDEEETCGRLPGRGQETRVQPGNGATRDTVLGYTACDPVVPLLPVGARRVGFSPDDFADRKQCLRASSHVYRPSTKCTACPQAAKQWHVPIRLPFKQCHPARSRTEHRPFGCKRADIRLAL